MEPIREEKMTDTIDDSLGALKAEVTSLCEEHNLSPDEAEFRVEITHNLELISLTTMIGMDDLIEGIEDVVKETDEEAMIFFVSPGPEDDLHITIRVGFFDSMSRWFVWV